MKEYYTFIDGEKIAVTKEVDEVLRSVRGTSRRERYVIYELAPKYELSLDGLIECDYPIEVHMVKPQETTEFNYAGKLSEELILHALKQLDQIEQQLIVAIYYEGLCDKEVAWLMEVPYTTFWCRKQSILKKLKKVINNLEF